MTFQLTVIWPLPPVALTPVGAGKVVVAFTGADASPSAFELLTADTV